MIVCSIAYCHVFIVFRWFFFETVNFLHFSLSIARSTSCHRRINVIHSSDSTTKVYLKNSLGRLFLSCQWPGVLIWEEINAETSNNIGCLTLPQREWHSLFTHGSCWHHHWILFPVGLCLNCYRSLWNSSWHLGSLWLTCVSVTSESRRNVQLTCW